MPAPPLGVLYGGPCDGLEIPAYTDRASMTMHDCAQYQRTNYTDAKGRSVYIYLKPSL